MAALLYSDDTGDITQQAVDYRPPAPRTTTSHRLRAWRIATGLCAAASLAALVWLSVHAGMSEHLADDGAAPYLRVMAAVLVILTMQTGTGWALASGQVSDRRRVYAEIKEARQEVHEDLERIEALLASTLVDQVRADGGYLSPESAALLRRVNLRIVRSPGDAG